MKKMMTVLGLALVLLAGCKQSTVKTEASNDTVMTKEVKAASFDTPVVLTFADSTVTFNDSLTCEALLKSGSYQKDSVTLYSYSKAIVDTVPENRAKNITVLIDSSLQFEKIYHLFRATSTVYDTFFLYHGGESLPVRLPKPQSGGLGFGSGTGSGFGPGGGAGERLGFSGGKRSSMRETPKPRLRMTTVITDSQAVIITGGGMVNIPFVVEEKGIFYSAQDERGATKVWRHKKSGEFLFVDMSPFSGVIESGTVYRHMSLDSLGRFTTREAVVDPAELVLQSLEAEVLYLCLISEICSQMPDAVDKNDMVYGIEGQVSMVTVLTFAVAAEKNGIANISFAKLRS